MSLHQVATLLYGENSYYFQQKAYGVISSVRADVEKDGMLLHCVDIKGRRVYKILNDPSEVRERIRSTTVRVSGGVEKLYLIKDILTNKHKSNDGVKEVNGVITRFKKVFE